MAILLAPATAVFASAAEVVKTLYKVGEEKGMFRVCFGGILCAGSLGIFQKRHLKTAAKRREMRI